MPIEGIGSAVEKAAPLVKFPILMRIVFPGTFAALCTYPFVNGWTTLMPTIFSLPIEWSRIIYGVLAVCFLGITISSLRGLTYKIYTGIIWPSLLFDKLCAFQRSRIRRLLAEQKQLSRDSARYDEIWQTLRLYPVDDKGATYASHPTLLGNIIVAYEKYPLTRYGMDSAFFWPRIWLLLEKEKKEEIDASWSMADGLLSLSAVAFIGGLSWAAVATAAGLGDFHLAHAGFPLDSPSTAALWSLGLLILGYFVYRISLGFRVRDGETFKAVFDLYREQLNPLLKANSDEIAKWRKAWAYLQYLVVETDTPKIPAQPTLITSAPPHTNDNPGAATPPRPKP